MSDAVAGRPREYAGIGSPNWLPFAARIVVRAGAMTCGAMTCGAMTPYGGQMIAAVLGVPGSGKSTAAGPLAEILPAYVVLDWDAFMAPASALAGREVRQSPGTWPAYRQLVRAVLDSVRHLPVAMLGVCTPAELSGWPIDA